MTIVNLLKSNIDDGLNRESLKEIEFLYSKLEYLTSIIEEKEDDITRLKSQCFKQPKGHK